VAATLEDLVVDPHHSTDDRQVLCALCGERIGVYEPAVFVSAGAVKCTSRAAMPGIEEVADYRPFHGVCYDRLDEAGG